jgi:Endonuclease/Exonuclease/phosphatase family
VDERYKVAQRLDFYIIEDSKLTPIHIFISHWPSRLWCEQNGADRHLLGIRLRDAVDEIYQNYNNIPNIILLGDYNDEPFDQSISIQLRATRDRILAAKKKDLLYNPFWRKLGTSQPYQSGDLVDHHAGSYYYRKNGISRWSTFDQIIFSSAFLGKTEWHLDEMLTDIIDISSIFSFLPKNHLSARIRNMFDR